MHQLSNFFWLSVLAMAAATIALICAVALMQAASVIGAGTVVAAIGAATLLAGISMFRVERHRMAETQAFIEQSLVGWRPSPT